MVAKAKYSALTASNASFAYILGSPRPLTLVVVASFSRVWVVWLLVIFVILLLVTLFFDQIKKSKGRFWVAPQPFKIGDGRRFRKYTKNPLKLPLMSNYDPN